MRWLVRMVTPPGGTVLEPFAGSGTTGEAALLEGFNAILIEQDPANVVDIERRIRRVRPNPADILVA
jgi:DNA modification methylase